MKMNAREEELIARALLADQSQIDVYLAQKRWAELAALVRFARRDVPVQFAQTDPALHRQLREQITRFFLRGGDVFSLKRITALPGCTFPQVFFKPQNFEMKLSLFPILLVQFLVIGNSPFRTIITRILRLRFAGGLAGEIQRRGRGKARGVRTRLD